MAIFDAYVVNKSEIQNSSWIQKLGYWFKGTFQAKQAASKIDEFMKQYLESLVLPPTQESLNSLKAIEDKLVILSNCS